VLPKGIKTSGFPAVEATCRFLGLEFDPWQRDLNRCILAKTKAGLYAADMVVISIPRQVGKTWDIGALVFADSIIHPGTTTIWTAHRFKVARETFDSLRAVALSAPLAPHIDPDQITTAAGNESIRFRNGSRIVFAARERGAIRGFTKVRRLILDEAQILNEHALADLVPTMNQAENPQIILMGTPPKPTDPGEAFTRLRTEALGGESEGVLYVEFAADEFADSDDRKQWAKANASYPKRTNTKAVQRMRKSLSDEDFRREGLGIWDGAGANILPNWPLCATAEPPPDPIALGIAVDPDRVWLSVAAASADPIPYLGAVLRVRLDSGKAHAIAEVARIQYEKAVTVTLDRGGPAGSLLDELEDAGIGVEVVGQDEFVKACADLTDAVGAKEVRHGDHPELNAAVAAAGWRKSGDRDVFARRNGEISMLESAALAMRAARASGPLIFQ
jgi:hypothetical protein